jgi:hypothetical protein
MQSKSHLLVLILVSTASGCSGPIATTNGLSGPSESNEKIVDNGENDSDEWLPSTDPTEIVGVRSPSFRLSEEKLVGSASNYVQAVSHPVFLLGRPEIIKSVARVQCGLVWGKSGDDTLLSDCQSPV